MKRELTQEERDFKLDDFTLNTQFTYWIVKSNCMWGLKEANKRYQFLRKEIDHATALEALKRKMFEMGIK